MSNPYNNPYVHHLLNRTTDTTTEAMEEEAMDLDLAMAMAIIPTKEEVMEVHPISKDTMDMETASMAIARGTQPEKTQEIVVRVWELLVVRAVFSRCVYTDQNSALIASLFSINAVLDVIIH